jgi:transposase-like protein
LKLYHKNKPDELKGATIRKREEREKYGSTLAEINRSIKRRRVPRPDRDELFAYVEEHGQVAAGEKWGVSQVTIHNWIKWYKKNSGWVDIEKEED